MGCHYCGTTEKDLRPYGPGGSMVCFPCATATPEREASAKAAFGALLDGAAAVTDVVAIGTDLGPTSLKAAVERASNHRTAEPADPLEGNWHESGCAALAPPAAFVLVRVSPLPSRQAHRALLLSIG